MPKARPVTSRETAGANDLSRPASPSRELLYLSPRTGMVASALSTAAVMGAWSLGPVAAVGSAVAVTALLGLRFGGRTVRQWAALRKVHRRLPEQSVLISRDGLGVIFDGTTATALVEITPRPWQLTTVSATGQGRSPQLSADVLRRQLRQYDISLAGLDVICAGYKFAARDGAAAALDTLIGPVSVPLGGTTVIAVSLELSADVLGPAYRRTRRKSLKDGLCQTLKIAATRVSYALAEQGFGGRLMSAAQVRDFHDSVLVQIARPLAQPGWRNCGPTTGVHTRTYVPARGHWNAESAGAWNHLPSHRQYLTLSLTPAGGSAALAQPLITYLVRGGDGLDKAAGFGLRPALGQQSAALGRALAVSRRRPLLSPAALIDDSRRLGFGLPAGGAGFLVGTREDKTRVFVAVSPTAEPLWISGPMLFAMQVVGRLSTQDQRIAIVMEDRRWQAMVDHRDTPVLTYGTRHLAVSDVVVCTPEWWELHRDLVEGKAVMLVTADDPGGGAVNSLVVERTAEGRSMITVSVDEQVTVVPWELTPIERRAVIGDAASGETDPDSDPALELDPVVNLPVSGERRSKPRPAAPAPKVATAGLAPAPGQAPPPVDKVTRRQVEARRSPVERPLTPPRQDVTQLPGAVPAPRKPERRTPDAPVRVPVPSRVVQPEQSAPRPRPHTPHARETVRRPAPDPGTVVQPEHSAAPRPARRPATGASPHAASPPSGVADAVVQPSADTAPESASHAQPPPAHKSAPQPEIPSAVVQPPTPRQQDEGRHRRGGNKPGNAEPPRRA